MTDLDGVHVGGVEVFALEQHLTFGPKRGDEVVHPVEAADEGALAAAGGADDRRDPSRGDAQVHVAEGLEAPIKDAEGFDLEREAGLLGGR